MFSSVHMHCTLCLLIGFLNIEQCHSSDYLLECIGASSCSDKEIICEGGTDSCTVNCQDAGSCSNATIYSASDETTISCKDADSCKGLTVYCGTPPELPSQVSNFSIFEANMTHCTVNIYNDNAFTDGTVKCDSAHGNTIDYCTLNVFEDNGGLSSSSMECSSSVVYCETLCSNDALCILESLKCEAQTRCDFYTNAPTNEPTPQPTSEPTKLNSISNNNNHRIAGIDTKTVTIALIIIIAVLAVIVVALLWMIVCVKTTQQTDGEGVELSDRDDIIKENELNNNNIELNEIEQSTTVVIKIGDSLNQQIERNMQTSRANSVEISITPPPVDMMMYLYEEGHEHNHEFGVSDMNDIIDIASDEFIVVGDDETQY